MPTNRVKKENMPHKQHDNRSSKKGSQADKRLQREQTFHQSQVAQQERAALQEAANPREERYGQDWNNTENNLLDGPSVVERQEAPLPKLCSLEEATFNTISTMADFIDCVLRWSPEVLKNEEYYNTTVDELPQLPDMRSVKEYTASFRQALRAEMQYQLSQIILHPDQGDRAMDTTIVLNVEDCKSFTAKGRESSLLTLTFVDSILARTTDMVYLSNSPNPLTDADAECFAGIVRGVGGTPEQKAVELHVEITRQYGKRIKEWGETGELFMIVISSIASSYRIMEALCGPEFSPLLMPNVLKPGDGTDVEEDKEQMEDHAATIDDLISRNKPLNDSQRLAIQRAMTPLAAPYKYPILIHGPPGTGKTHTLASMIMAISMRYPGQLVHVVAPSNAALREVAIRLVRDARQSGILHLSRIVLFGHEDTVDTTEDIDMIYSEYRVRRLRNITTRLEDWKLKIRTFYETVVSLDNAATWNWRQDTVKEGCRILSTLCFDIPPEFFNCHNEMQLCLESLEDWRSGFNYYKSKPGNLDALDDPLQDLIEIVQKNIEAVVFKYKSIRKNPFNEGFVLGETRVAFSTVNSAGKGFLFPMLRRPSLVIIDEATQCIEAEMSILLSRTNLRGLVAIGDPQQLPGTVSNRELEKRGYGVSLFERLILANSPSTALNVQYRMHPDIAFWPKKAFYKGGLKDDLQVKSSERKPEWQTSDLLLPPYSFIHVWGTETKDKATQGYFNVPEANTAKKIIENLLTGIGRVPRTGTVTVGIITGYSAQVDLIARRIGSIPEATLPRTNSRIRRVLIPMGKHSRLEIDIASVDGFQGQERDIILFCTTRANGGKSIGFLKDPRRLNVAITRARFCLNILGHVPTLSKSNLWKTIILDSRDRKSFFEIGDPAESAVYVPRVKPASTAPTDWGNM